MRRISLYRRGIITLTPFPLGSILLRHETCHVLAKSQQIRKATQSALVPSVISGSGAVASVHCGGTEQIWPSAKRNNHRLPDRLPRLAMHSPFCPLYGWKGWVTVKSSNAADEPPAFLTELQAAGERGGSYGPR